MRKILLKLILLTVSIISLMTPISNNVALAYSFGQTCSLYSIAQYGGSNISIESETLTFKADNENTLPNTLTTEYIITGNENTNAQIVLPVFGQLMDGFEKYKAIFNDVEITPQIRYSLKYSFEDFTGDFLSNTYNVPFIFDDSLCGTLYTFISNEPYSVSFILEKGQKIFYSGFNGMSGKQGANIKTECTLSKDSFGNDFNCSIYVSNGTLNFIDTPAVQTDVTEMSYNDYLLNYYVEEYPHFYLHATNIFKYFIDSQNDIINDLIPNSTHVIFLIYDIVLSSSANNFVLERPLPNLNQYSDDNPVTYQIINSPVRSFSSFGNTQINIATNKLPYINETKFEKISDNTFSYNGNLTSHDKYEIILDNINNNGNGNNNNQLFWVYISLGIAGGLTVIILIIYYLVKKHRSL